MNILLIDSDLEFLKQLSQKGLQAFCAKGENLSEIVSEISNNFSSVEKIYVNLSLVLNDSNKRLDYLGIILMQRLMFECNADSWVLLSFEKAESIRKKHNAQILSKLQNIEIVDYITFLKEAAKNAGK